MIIIVVVVILLLLIWATPNVAQGLLLDVNPGTTPGST